MYKRLLARQRLVTITDSTHVYCDLAPAQGQAWKVLYCVGSHNDGAAARDCSFYFTDNIAATTTQLANAVSRATGILHQLYEGAYCPEPLILRSGHFLRFYVPAAVGGTTLTVSAVVEEIIGEDNYGE